MRESRPYGSVRGAPSNGRPYREHNRPRVVVREPVRLIAGYWKDTNIRTALQISLLR